MCVSIFFTLLHAQLSYEHGWTESGKKYIVFYFRAEVVLISKPKQSNRRKLREGEEEKLAKKSGGGSRRGMTYDLRKTR